MKIQFNIFAGLLLMPGCLYAEHSSESSSSPAYEDMFLEDLPVVISATRLKQPINEAPVAISVIDQQMIKASGAQTIVDILRLVPGFTVGYLNGNYPVATYHGQSDRYSKRIQLVIDGRSVYLPTLSGVSWSDLVITLDEIERIEVVRGPNASTYGNNAFQAVVSITTKHASENKGQYIKMTGGKHDTADLLYRFGDHTEKLDYRVSLGTKNNDGTRLLNDFTETDYLSYRLDYQINTNSNLFYQGGYQDSTYGDVKENEYDTDNNVYVSTAYQHLKYELQLENSDSLSIQYYYNYTKSYNSNVVTTVSLSPLSPLLAAIDDFNVYDTIALESERHDLEIDYYFNPTESLRLISGASIRTDKVLANNVFLPNTDNSLMLYRAFSHGEYRVTDDWIINAGLMIENNDISGTDVAPRLALIHNLTKQHSFRISASKATRTPTIFNENGYYAFQQQLTQNGGQALDNPTLENIIGGDVLVDTVYYSSGNVDSEEITSYELGWVMSLLKNNLMIDIKVFSDETRKLISEVPFSGDLPTENIGNLFGADYSEVGAIDFSNAAGTKSRGFELYSNYQISQDWRIYNYFSYISLDATLTDPNASAAVVGRLEASVPHKNFGALIMKQWEDNLNTSLAIYSVGNMDWLDRTSSRTNPIANKYNDRSAEAYTRLDFILRKSYYTANMQIDASIILQNINGMYFDYTMTSYTDPSRETIATPGSAQDPRAYFELAILFN